MESTIERLRHVADQLVDPSEQDVEFAKAQLNEFVEIAIAEEWSHVLPCATTLVNLLELAESSTGCLDSDLDVPLMIEYVQQGVRRIVSTLESKEPDFTLLSDTVDNASEIWGLEVADSEVGSLICAEDPNPFEPVESPDNQIGLILDAIQATNILSGESDSTDFNSALDTEVAAIAQPFEALESHVPLERPKPQYLDLDVETIEAFTDDAFRCLTSIENAVLGYENHPSAAPLEQICRDLHTLKGASASINLNSLARFLHQVEDRLDFSFRSGESANVDMILQCVDSVREQLSAFTPTEGVASQAVAPLEEMDRSPDSIRVQGCQIDRLLDMLAELVMLRNRRDSQVDQLKEVNVEVLNCVSRIRLFEETIENALVRKTDLDSNSSRGSISSLSEIANDLLEVGRGLRETFEPLVEENSVLSRFIRQFRGEMMELQRLPIGGLFNRLQRIVRDAAKAEGKQIKLVVSGEQHGLERSLHDKLFEPLMHIVRNSVSHGIEPEAHRHSSGKPVEGQLSIEARKGTNLFVIEVRDDGKV